jgi:hypothetical protein
MRARLSALVLALRQDMYEAAIAFACLLSGYAAVRGAVSGAAARVLPLWSIRPMEALLCVGGALTLGAMVTVGLSANPVRRAMACKVEQGGQALLAGLLFAVACGAFSAGESGLISGALYTALACAAAARAMEIASAFRSAGISKGVLRR